jgi:hypothetical protein
VKIPPEPSFRARTNYANEALYVSPSATGYHFAGNTLSDPDCKLRNIPYSGCSGNLVRQLARIQSMDYGFQVNRVDANQFGQAARIASTMLSSPDVSLNFEYLLADGYNEQLMQFVIDGETSTLSKHIYDEDHMGMNFFITTVEEGHDVNKNYLLKDQHNKSVVGIGNAHLSQYAITAEVGSIPKARVSFEGFNIRSYTGICNLPAPSLNPTKSALHGECADVRFSIPDTWKSFECPCEADYMEHFVLCDGVSALRPGDILIDLQAAGLFSEQLSGFDEASNQARSSAHIQGFTINIPLGNTRINRLGRHVEFARTINFPVNASIQIDAIVGSLKEAGIWEAFASVPKDGTPSACRPKFDLTFMFNDCGGVVCDNASNFKQVTTSMLVKIKDAVVESEAFTSNIGDNKLVTLNLSAPVGSQDDKDRGIFISGRCYMEDRPTILSFGNPL